jgi:predicted cupin superfamily sugar epimerase
MHAEALRTIEALSLAPHPEGGHYREIFRSPHSVTSDDGRRRPALTVIYFLLTGDEYSTWHRLASDETWHFARGDALVIDLIDAAGRHETLRVGPDGPWEATIPATSAFAARVESGGFALVTCCVAPGFAFEDFELLEAAALCARYPQHAHTIERYTRS